MGLCASCCKKSADDYNMPDLETRRQHQVEAAERRRLEQQSRGIKDPEKVHRQIQRAEELIRREEEAAKYRAQGGGGGLRWQVS